MCDQTPHHTTLGIIAKSVDPAALVRRNELRKARYALQDVAAGLLGPDHRTCTCGRKLASGRDMVQLRLSSDKDGNRFASFHNVETCSSVWACPVCSARISEVRRRELNTLLAVAREQGLHVCMLSLTLRHNHEMRLVDTLEVLKRAKKRFHQSKRWRGLRSEVGLVGTVTATEVTYGNHGWHPHLHMLVVSELDPWVALDALQAIWLRSLHDEGGNGNQHAYDVQDATSAGNYVGKWGAGEELVVGGRKAGRNGSRSPLQLLSDAPGDFEAESLWLEYERTMRGRRQLVWSRGFKDFAGLVEVTDEEAVESEGDELTEVASVRIDGRDWAIIVACDLRAEILERAEESWIELMFFLQDGLWKGLPF